MAAMNVSTQRRLGKLPKTEDTLSYKGHTYGNTHRGFRGRRPHQPTKASMATAALAVTANSTTTVMAKVSRTSP